MTQLDIDKAVAMATRQSVAVADHFGYQLATRLQ